MRYKVRRQGDNLGEFTLDELRRRHETGEFSGGEYVQLEGMTDWQPLNLVLRQGYNTTLPAPPPLASKGISTQTIILGSVLVAVGLLVLFGVFFARMMAQVRQNAFHYNSGQYSSQSSGPPVAASQEPVVWTTNTLTAVDASRRDREFVTRQWLDGYQQRGQRNPECDAEVVKFLEAWIASNYGGDAATNETWLNDESEKLAADKNCTDPLALTALANCAGTTADAVKLYERALSGFSGSSHRAYPEFYANIQLAADLNRPGKRQATYETNALPLFKKCFSDGSFTTNDQQKIAESLVNSWGYNFYGRHAAEVCDIAHAAGPDYQWLAMVLDGEREIIAAWAARGNGFTDSVTTQGWQGFASHLARARTNLVAAWNLQPMWALAPERMIYVSLGDSNIDEMRVWFDRTTTAQIDYNRAWSDFRWGLRPRWYGNVNSLLAIGVAGVNTGRFDTDVPRKYIDAIYNVESEIGEPKGRHIFGRADIWPNLQRMYEGYLAAPSQSGNLAGWRTSYAVVAYFAGQYGDARTQLEALNWKPVPENLTGWGVNLSQMPLEVAARTGKFGITVSAAEFQAHNGYTADAIKKYNEIAGANADPLTGQFVQLRLHQLGLAKQLNSGEWVDWLPANTADPGWDFNTGQFQVLADGALQVKSTSDGHAIYCNTSINTNFEARGQFETVQPGKRDAFQAGLDFGDTSLNRNNWFSFRIRHSDGHDTVSLGRGWTRTEILRPATLNATTNAFDFIFQDGLVTASINGVEIFHQTPLPAEFSAPDGALTFGLDALTRADTVVCYRHIQIRKLN